MRRHKIYRIAEKLGFDVDLSGTDQDGKSTYLTALGCWSPEGDYRIIFSTPELATQNQAHDEAVRMLNRIINGTRVEG